MTKNPNLYRPALTAIAAVLASTPLAVAAQTVPTDAGTPPTVSSPAPVAQPTIVIDPVTTTAPEPGPRATIAPEAMRQVADEAIADAMAAPTPRAARTTSAATPRTTAAPRTPAAVSPVASPVADNAVAADTFEQPAIAIAPAPVAANDGVTAPAPVDQPTVAINDNALVTGGLIGLALMGLGGFALAMRRRRSNAALPVAQGYEPERRAEAVPQPVAYTAPATARAAAPAMALSTRNDQVTGGSHVERAMRGPTADNPFLTLRKRLARARFLDKREQSGSARTGFGGYQPALA